MSGSMDRSGLLSLKTGLRATRFSGILEESALRDHPSTNGIVAILTRYSTRSNIQ